VLEVNETGIGFPAGTRELLLSHSGKIESGSHSGFSVTLAVPLHPVPVISMGGSSSRRNV
jgi:hypothetical protein